MRITLIAFALATLGGVALAILFSQSRIVEYALYPFAVVLQVTPVVAIAPLLLIWIGYDNINEVLVVLAWIIAFFTVLSNTVTGLRSADHNLIDLMKLYGASRWQILWRLQLPSALPYLLAGMKISGGLALIGAVTAEFVAGSGNDLGLGWIITLASRNLDTAEGVRGAGAALDARHRDPVRDDRARMGAAASLARQRGEEAGSRPRSASEPSFMVRGRLGQHLAGLVADQAFDERRSILPRALDPGFGDDEAGRRGFEETDLDLQRQRIGRSLGLRHHDMRHRRIDPAGDEAALHDAAGMAHVHARAIVDDGASALAAVDRPFPCRARLPRRAVRLRLLFAHDRVDSSFATRAGADSAIIIMATMLSAVANSRYQDGASGFPVTWVSQAMKGCVEPPNTAIEVA